jgi:ubiquinone/menaquinone biosynthesis C-methylase UbiE
MPEIRVTLANTDACGTAAVDSIGTASQGALDQLSEDANMQEAQIQDFWEHHPCGDRQVGGLAAAFAQDYETFFREYDAFRYRREGHILGCLDGIHFHGRKILEIGLGQGADSEQIIRRGGYWSGLDLTTESVARVRTRLQLRNLPYDDIRQGSALEIPYPNASFDMVFSHGVLHHIPEIRAAQAEIARVLKPDGELIIMVYAKWSFNHIVAISLLRRLGLSAMHFLGMKPGGIYSDHLQNARRCGLWNYMKIENFIHKNTDGPHNPYSKVYDRAEIRKDFPAFRIDKSYKRWMHGPPLPVSWLPLGNLMGWHLWVHLKPRTGLASRPQPSA